ncbi:MAG TPA: gliding motility-associated ABC transporter substrate-binding protein GldG [Phaeodactylibacter sp.]|nr:gliding motility-associated ABC transporter substrate-binding protein GldG [Phaeodactylibacter sp.]
MWKSKKAQAWFSTGMLALILVFLNILGNAFFFKWDLTEDKRFTITSSTRELLKDLDDVVYVRVLLEGEFPAGFKRLQKATREMLDDFRSWSGYIEYEFEDPSDPDKSVEEINARHKQLEEAGILPVTFRLRTVGGGTQKRIYPYAIFYYKGRSIPVSLLEEQRGRDQDLVLNNSISLLEYKFANAIMKLRRPSRAIVAFTSGHGELDDLQTKDLRASLRTYYDVGRFTMDSTYAIPSEISLLIIAKPTQPFSEKDKFKLDQYVMNGGKVMFLLDKLAISLDSLVGREGFVPPELDLKLDDLLFKYGARIQPSLVQDLRCSKIPQVIGSQNGKPQIELFKWVYHPVSVPDIDHPIVKGVDGVNFFFANRLDTIRTKTPVKKTILLSSSKYSREQFSPAYVTFKSLHHEPRPENFKESHLPLAVLLEGTFPSLYENRLSKSMEEGLKELGMTFKKESVPNRMLVVADGDVANNFIVDRENRTTMPLGYNRYERNMYANKDFLLNGIEYLMDEAGVMQARGKEIKLRLLDQVRARKEKTYWQMLNILLPLLFLLLFGMGYHYLRKRKYAR